MEHGAADDLLTSRIPRTGGEWVRDGRWMGDGRWAMGESGDLSHTPFRPSLAGERLLTCLSLICATAMPFEVHSILMSSLGPDAPWPSDRNSAFKLANDIDNPRFEVREYPTSALVQITTFNDPRQRTVMATERGRVL